ncbi:MAG: carotenoid oxygenase family protein [Myxococcales bacterium]|nr:carotenoid oxygenase family protein [Myxococcales bacterium]
MARLSKTPLSPRSRSWNTAMAAFPGDLDLTFAPDQIEGKIPASLYQTRLLSNGPGWTKIGKRLAHPFDGHGYVRSFSFLPDGSCQLKARFVRTPVYLNEARAGRIMHRGLGTNREGHFWDNMRSGIPRNVANTTITRWGDQLLAGWEGGAPYALDAESLETIGEKDFNGLIAGQSTLAHMKHDAAQQRLVLCSHKSRKETLFTFRELDKQEQLVSTNEVSIEGMLFTHDFALSPSYYVLGGNPLRLKPFELLKMALGADTLLNAIAPDNRQPGCLYLVPRQSGGETRKITLPHAAFVIHFGNAFEEDGAVIVDACVFSSFEMGHEFGYTGPHTPFDPALPDEREPQRLIRIKIPAGATEASYEPLAPYGIDFPRFHPQHESQETPFLFGATRKDTRHSDPFDSLVCIDLLDPERPHQLWTAPEDVFVGEPIFAPDPTAPNKGHILAILSDGLKERSTLVIFDATRLQDGPLASIPMPLLPIAFHGDWDAQAL